jgi:hypothetical protein
MTSLASFCVFCAFSWRRLFGFFAAYLAQAAHFGSTVSSVNAMVKAGAPQFAHLMGSSAVSRGFQ